MTIQELIDLLAAYRSDDIVIVAKDREGNAFSPAEHLSDDLYLAETTYRIYSEHAKVGRMQHLHTTDKTAFEAKIAEIEAQNAAILASGNKSPWGPKPTVYKVEISQEKKRNPEEDRKAREAWEALSPEEKAFWNR